MPPVKARTTNPTRSRCWAVRGSGAFVCWAKVGKPKLIASPARASSCLAQRYTSNCDENFVLVAVRFQAALRQRHKEAHRDRLRSLIELSTGTLFSFPAADWRRQILKIVLVLELVLVLRLLRNLALEQTQHYLAFGESASQQSGPSSSSSSSRTRTRKADFHWFPPRGFGWFAA
jgi:hypothetical protein